MRNHERAMAAADDIDLALIAAFIDGRLSGAERDRVVRLLNESEAALEIYADAVSARQDVGEPAVVPISSAEPRRRRPWMVAVPAAAAAVLLLAIMPTVRAKREQSLLHANVASIAGPISVGAGLPTTIGAGWDQHGWTVMRGEGSTFVDSITAFRLGVGTTDLHIALAAGDRARALRIANSMVELLESMSLADAVGAEYQSIRDRVGSGEPVTSLLPSSQRAEDRLDTFLNSPWFGIGKWLGAGAVAARAHSGDFFTSDRTAQFLTWATASGRLAPRDVELLRQIPAVSGRAMSDADFERTGESFAELIRRHGN